jgi:hypothetical protein
MIRRSLFVLPAVLAATALPVTPALAGEDDGGDSDSAKLHASSSCVLGKPAKAVVSGDGIVSVAFYVNGKLVKRDSSADSSGRYAVAMRCARLHVGANRGSAVVTSAEGSRQVLRFQITRLSQASPRFTG